MQVEEIKHLLESHLSDCDVDVSGDGSHFDVTVIGDVFEGLNAVKKQQLVYGGLGEQIADGSIHAVNIKTFTRSEWKKQ
jgi:acid stress-induced BolA-like protein IbaG/YrbA